MKISYKCYNKDCNFFTNYKEVYESHCTKEHKGKPAYPGIADIELYGWIAQGREWEAPVNRKNEIQNYADKLTQSEYLEILAKERKK